MPYNNYARRDGGNGGARPSRTDTKVLIAQLYEKTSARGVRYLTGKLGPARVIAFVKEVNGELVWNVFVKPSQEQSAAGRPIAKKAPQVEGNWSTELSDDVPF